MPREAQATTASDGSFGGLVLDPGRYLLRVRPADGTRLPWFVVPSFPPVAPAGGGPPLPVEAGKIEVPVPVSAGLTLLDPGNNAVVRALVRVFTMPIPAPQPPAGQCMPPMTETATPVPAVEVGRAITDATGHYELYLAPPSQ
jgi:hypothetical protein